MKWLPKILAAGVLFVLSLDAVGLAATTTWLSAAGGNATKWDRAQNWSGGAIPTASDTVAIPSTPANGTGFPLLTTNGEAAAMAIANGASVTCGTGFTLSVTGDVIGGTLNGGAGTINIGGLLILSTFNPGLSTVVFNGTSLQTVGGYSFYNVTVNNPAGVVLTGNMNVSNILTLTNGVVTTGSNRINTTSQANNAVVITNGSINGEIQRYVFKPVEPSNFRIYRFTDANTYLMLPNPCSQTITVKSFPGQQPVPTPGTGAAINRYYTIDVPDTLTATVRLAYAESELNGILEVDLTSFRHNGTAWVDQGGTVDTANNFVELTNVTTFSPWTLGDITNPLPIQLMNFTAAVVNQNTVRLDWATLTETNNYGFQVQRSANNTSNYETLPNSFVPGHGTTLEPQYYTWTDANAQAGVWYYRLKQIDLNSTVHYTDGIQVVNNPTSVGNEGSVVKEYSLNQNFPNPFNPSTVIEFALPQAGFVSLKVYNLLGAEVATLVSSEMTAGRHSVSWNASDLASGVYLYRLKAGTFVQTRKLTLSK